MKLTKYVMGYSQAEQGNMVVYALTYEDAVKKFEDGEYSIQ